MQNSTPTAIIIAINLKQNQDFAEDVLEAESLALSAGYEILEIVTFNRASVDLKYFMGSGKVEEIKSLCNALTPDTVIINHNISPVQERNLNNYLNLPVIDRTQLILDIFAARANTNEGILQIELANQSHLITRLVGRWSHLERQKGGIGMRGGPGEKQIELDKRMIATKIVNLKKRLNTAIRQRQTRRRARIKSGLISLAIVGYTNAGKSTLFNTLTKANVYAEDRLFATLDTTTRHLFIDENHEVVLSDTVGFIRDLPHKLVAAFRATLEETVFADILLHVVDIHSSIKERNIEDVNTVLTEIKANQIPQLIIYNKIDLINNITPHINYNEYNDPIEVYLSAANNSGLDKLRQAIIEKIAYLSNNKSIEQELNYEPWKYK